jgi:hypothetical protein
MRSAAPKSSVKATSKSGVIADGLAAAGDDTQAAAMARQEIFNILKSSYFLRIWNEKIVTNKAISAKNPPRHTLALILWV